LVTGSLDRLHFSETLGLDPRDSTFPSLATSFATQISSHGFIGCYPNRAKNWVVGWLGFFVGCELVFLVGWLRLGHCVWWPISGFMEVLGLMRSFWGGLGLMSSSRSGFR
jgi:hypothetical protein